MFAACGLARADVAYDNFGPGSTFSGNGFLVTGPGQPSTWWTHAFPITPTLSGQITTVTVALHHLAGATNNYTYELRSDAGGSPGPVLATLGQAAGFIGGSVPIQFAANPGATITAGTQYWIYARGEGDATGTWRTSLTTGGFRAYSFNGGSTFTVTPLSPTDAQGAVRIEVAGSCYADCDGVGGLTGNDFQCFLDKYVTGDAYANCDGVGGLTGNDFQCFVNKYVAGCT